MTHTESGPPAVGTQAVPATAPPIVPPSIPLAGRITVEQPGAGSGVTRPSDAPAAIPLPPFQLCRTDFRDGCWSLTYEPTFSLFTYRGTLRVDRSDPDAGPDGVILSGDLYARRRILPPLPSAPGSTNPMNPTDPGNPSNPPDGGSGSGSTDTPGTTGEGVNAEGTSEGTTAEGSSASGTDGTTTQLPDPAGSMSLAAAVSTPGGAGVPVPFPLRRQIPIYPRAEYHSYLKGVRLSVPTLVPAGQPCTVTIDLDQFDYTQPLAGSFQGSFPTSASRAVTLRLTPSPSPFPSPLFGPSFSGRWLVGGADRGQVTLTWVSKFFRRATVEIDTLQGAVAPQPVPDGAGGTEYFDTIYAKHGWDLRVVSDETNLPAPAGVNPDACWSSGDLHNFMSAHRSPTTDLDTDWRLHLSVVPATMGCGRGVMFDLIGVPREGCSSFSNDGYPDTDSANFGAAANQRQHDVPRAFLRSATHEITHTFNQIHQEQETAPDNSIMTTTPSVADVLGGPTTGLPGVFPDQIALAVNTTVRHHLNHMPDPVIRPGGWPFASWFGANVPQAGDRQRFDPSELELAVAAASDRVSLGQPLDLSWTLTNRSGGPLLVPLDVSLEALFGSITITDAEGRQRGHRPFVIRCESAKIGELAAGDSVSARAQVFWSTDGFAFPRAGAYRVTVAVSWSARGVPVTVTAEVPVFVDFPTTDADNQGAALVMHREVGTWVALGGNAYHLTEATRRLSLLAEQEQSDAGPPRLLAGFRGLLPDPSRVQR